MRPEASRQDRTRRVLYALPLMVAIGLLAFAWSMAFSAAGSDVVELGMADPAVEPTTSPSNADAAASEVDEPAEQTTPPRSVEPEPAHDRTPTPSGGAADPASTATREQAGDGTTSTPGLGRATATPTPVADGSTRSSATTVDPTTGDATPTETAQIDPPPPSADPSPTAGRTRPSRSGATATPTRQPTATPTPTTSNPGTVRPSRPTAIPSPTATAAPNPTPTRPPVSTAIPTPPSPTSTPTPRAAPSSTPTPTPRPAPTATVTPLPAATATLVPTPTSTPTVTPEPTPAGPQPVGNPGNWQLTFEDTFDFVDRSKWETAWFSSTDYTTQVNHNGGACFHPGQVSASGGNLELRLAPNSDERCRLKNGERADYVGALVNTRQTYTFSYGYAEARVFLPGSGGSLHNWPAFWHTGFDWPATGEVDVVEGLSGGQPCSVYHYQAGGQHQQSKSCVNWPDPVGWHVFAADWEPGRITFYYDGVEVFQTTQGVVGSPHYLIFDYTVRANGTGTSAPSTMLVDYVRVWQRPN